MLTKNEIKRIQSLNRKKNRTELGLFVAEGEKLVSHLLVAGLQPQDIYASNADLIESATVISKADLKRISIQKSPAPVLGVFKIPKIEVEPFTAPIVLVLDGIRDPGNMGTIIRLCDWFGISQVICTPDCVDVFNEKVVQASMGSIATVPCIELPRYEVVRLANLNNYELIGTDMKGQSIYATDFAEKTALVIGNEGQGISPELEIALGKKVTIPAANTARAESLNAAVATSIVVSEMFRKRV